MADPIVAISFRDLEADEEIRTRIDGRCRAFAEEFPETTRFEMTLAPDGSGHSARIRVSGRDTHLDAHADAIELELAAERALDKVRVQLRTLHDKRIFARRREARKNGPRS